MNVQVGYRSPGGAAAADPPEDRRRAGSGGVESGDDALGGGGSAVAAGGADRACGGGIGRRTGIVAAGRLSGMKLEHQHVMLYLLGNEAWMTLPDMPTITTGAAWAWQVA